MARAGRHARLGRATGLPVEILSDDRFFCSTAGSPAGPKGAAGPDGAVLPRHAPPHRPADAPDGEPEGGRWNFDADNRKPLPNGWPCPSRPLRAGRSHMRRAGLVAAASATISARSLPFWFAVTRAQALRRWTISSLRPCRVRRLPGRDAAGRGLAVPQRAVAIPELRSAAPGEVCAAVERAWRGGHAPLNGAEGFIRQILGWREYVRGIYWLKMPGYAA